jgi:hypothetical protein
MGTGLLQHLSAANANQHGITIHGEAVVDGQHTLFLILDAASQTTVEQFMQPFAMAGTVEVLPSSPCEAVVARLGCD